MESNDLLGTEDIVVIMVCLAVPLIKGIVFAVKERLSSMKDRFLPGERIDSLASVTISIFATYMSAVTLMGSPTDVYVFGCMYAVNHIGFGIAFLIGSFTVVPLLHPLGISSVFEYMEKRYDSLLVRQFFVMVTVIMMMFFMGISLLPPALGVEVGAGVDYSLCIIIVGSIATFYTLIGGLKSFVWTDAFLCSLMFVAFSVLIARVTLTVGGGNSALILAEAGGRTDFNQISPDPRERHTWWGTVLGGTAFWLFFAYSQSTVKRLSGVKSITSVKLTMVINGFLVIIYGAFVLGLGMMIYAFFHYKRCDPLKAGLIKNRNQTPPFFALVAMKDHPGIPGLYMAALFSSALCTVSSGINSMASNTMDEILKKPLARYSELCRFFINKVFILFYGLVVIGLGFVAIGIEGTVAQKIITIVGAFGSPVTGAFLLGAVSLKANKFGALVGGAASIAVNLWLVIGMHLHGRKIRPLPGPPSDMCFLNTTLFSVENDSMTSELPSTVDVVTGEVDPGSDSYGFTFFMYDISYVWYGVIGVLVTFFVGLVVSMCTSRYVTKETDPLLVFRIFRQCTAKVSSTKMDVYEAEAEAVTYTFTVNSDPADVMNKTHIIDGDDVTQVQYSTHL
nr:sodium-coupled monocarboxylate transporter 1-like [Biomphalaria glabrata]